MVTYKEITGNGSYSDTAMTNNVWVIDEGLDGVSIDDVDYGVRATTEEELRHGSDAYVVKNLNNSGVTITDWNQYQETRVDAPANSVTHWDGEKNVVDPGAYAEADVIQYYVNAGPGKSGYKTLEGYTLTRDGIVDGGGNPLTSYYFSDVDITLTFEQMRNSNFKYNNGDGPNFYDSEGTPLVGYHEYGPHEIVTTKAYDLNTPDDTLYIQNVTGDFTVYFDVVSSEQKYWEDEQSWGYDGIHNSMVISADNVGVDIHDWTASEGSVVLNHFQIDAHPLLPVNDGIIEKIRIGDRIIDQTSFATAVTTIRAWLDTKYVESSYDDIYYNTRQVLDSDNEAAKSELKDLYKSLITTTDLGLLDQYSADELTFTKSGDDLIISYGETSEIKTGFFADSKNTTVTTFNTESGIYEINEIADLSLVYKFAKGDGEVTLNDIRSIDIIQFTDNAFAGLVFSRVGDNLKIDYNSANDTDVVTVTDFFADETTTNFDSLIVTDGIKSVLADAIIDVAMDSASYVGTDYKENIVGTDVANTITGAHNSDTLTGNDGDDTFVFNTGDGKDSITDAEAGDIIKFADKPYTSLSFARVYGYSLEISYSENDKVIIDEFFVDDVEDRVNDLITFDDGVETPHKISDVAVFNIILDKISGPFDKDAAGYTGYKVNISLDKNNHAGFVSNLEAGDNINLANSTLSRNWDGSKNDYLTLSYGQNSISVTDYFEGEAYSAITVNKEALSNALDVTLANENVYTATNFVETIRGTGSVTGMSADDNVAVAGTYSRLNNGGLIVTDENNNITIADYFTTGTNLKVNGDVIPDGMPLRVVLTDNTTYSSTRFAEAVSGTGSFVGMGINDKIVTDGEPVYTRLNDGNLFVDNIEVKGFYWDGKHNISVNDDTTADMTVNVTLTDNFNYKTTAYSEIITGDGSISGGTEKTIAYMGYACEDDAVCVGNDITFTYIKEPESTDYHHITIKEFFSDEGEILFNNCYVDGDNGGYEHVAYNDITLNVSGRTSFSNIITYEGEKYTIFNAVNIKGTLDEDVYVGGENNDRIEGGAGDDIIIGDDGDDFLDGGSGGDIIQSGDGDDTIIGGLGNDIIMGGFGAKTFVFNSGDGNDAIYDSKYGDVLAITDVKFDDITFARSTKEEHTDDLVISYGEYDSITLAKYFDVSSGARMSTFLTFDGEHTYIFSDEEIPEEEIQENKGNVVIDKETEGDVRIDATTYTSTSTKGVTVSNKSKTANIDVTGSDYNDKITSKYGNNTIVESAGNNKITTGAGNDVIETTDYSSNTINAGAGENAITLSSVGKNKVKAGNGDNAVFADNGSNNIRLGNGSNSVEFSGGVNTVRTGKGMNKFDINGGVNTVNTSKGADTFVIVDGNNNIKSGDGIDKFEIYGGQNKISAGKGAKIVEDGKKVAVGNTIEIIGGYNTVKSGSYSDTVSVTGGSNNISTGAGNDKVFLDGGVNTVNAGKGDDTVMFTYGKNYVDGGEGNDIYQVDMNMYDFNNGKIFISDKSGKNVLDVTLADATDKLNLFFDVEVGKKGKAVYSEMLFTDKDAATVIAGATALEDNFDLIEGIGVSSKKTISTIRVNDTAEYTINSKEIDKLASDIAGWLSVKGYLSTDDVFNAEKTTGDIDTLIAKYTAFADNNYVYQPNA